MKNNVITGLLISSFFYSYEVLSQPIEHLPKLEYQYNMNRNVNPNRARMGLPPLTGGVKQDLFTVSEECSSGIEASCNYTNYLWQLCTKNCQTEGPSYRYECENNCLTRAYPDSTRNRAYSETGGGDSSNTRHAICIGECGRKCSIMPSQEGVDECRAEERACEARCP